MKESQDPMIPRKMELDKNTQGTELKISKQKELKKQGRQVALPGVKTHNMILIKDGEKE